MGVHSFVPTTTLSSHKWNKCCALLSFQRVSMDGIGCQRYCDHPWTDNSLPPPSEYPWMPGHPRTTLPKPGIQYQAWHFQGHLGHVRSMFIQVTSCSQNLVRRCRFSLIKCHSRYSVSFLSVAVLSQLGQSVSPAVLSQLAHQSSASSNSQAVSSLVSSQSARAVPEASDGRL